MTVPHYHRAAGIDHRVDEFVPFELIPIVVSHPLTNAGRRLAVHFQVTVHFAAERFPGIRPGQLSKSCLPENQVARDLAESQVLFGQNGADRLA